MEASLVSGSWKGFLGKGLAPRELQCVMGLAQGWTQKEIARELGVSPAAVTQRVTSAMYKLQVHRAAALVAEAMRKGIVGPLMILLASFGGYQAATSLDSDHLRRGPSRRVVELRVIKARDEAAQTV